MTKPLTSVAALIERGLALPENAAALDEVASRYAISISPILAGLVTGREEDPIARQFVPRTEELVQRAEERADPIGDEAHSPVPGIVHRHKDRVLLKAVSTCPVYCRFCFRRETVGQGDGLSAKALEHALSYIAAHQEIWEVILTGGDPFILSPRRVRALSQRLAAIPHVKVVRWHTRVPLTDPARVDDALVDALKVGGSSVWVALHANHPREFSRESRAAISRLADAGIPLVSQSVLLKGVNDDSDTLERLMRAFVEQRVKPYYLHHPDLAPGTSHFRITLDEGLALLAELRERLSGLAMPTYMLDLPGGFGKVALEPRNVKKTVEGWRVRDAKGVWHEYPPSLWGS
jgi:lysine 2,3-aminomutase